jgi:hypothetical protein
MVEEHCQAPKLALKTMMVDSLAEPQLVALDTLPLEVAVSRGPCQGQTPGQSEIRSKAQAQSV